MRNDKSTRYYNPSTGRFISEDPIGILAGLNLYRYTINNPIRFIDSYGLTEQDVLDAVQFVLSKTSFEEVSFNFGTPDGVSGVAIPFLNLILVDSKYRGELTYQQKRALLQTVYHEMVHVTDGTLKSLLNTEEEHENIHLEAIKFSTKYWNDFARPKKDSKSKKELIQCRRK